jgi:3'-phosphoadenosine 5'-phosphosulfate sulfotransferase (PAPS reductase)/FAD synthetase
MINMSSVLNYLLEKSESIKNLTIFDSFIKSAPKLETNKKIVCSVSGGADSDIMLDIFATLDGEGKVKYIFFDTGIEYEATKKHLDFLEKKYYIKIERVKATVPVPLGCRKYGLPFWSKNVSEMIYRLQRHGFKWEDRPYEELIKEYPKCKIALRWWCNRAGENSRFNISHTKWLKEYMIANPPSFKISVKCCNGAKKNVSKKYLKEYGADLHLLGVRKAEGGARSTAYKSCFTAAKDNESWDNYRPIFWYSDSDKEAYEKLFNVTHSACYTEYGLKRTGCAGCPFGKRFEEELEICRKYEPKLYKAINKIFGASYEYTRGFLKFREDMKEREQNL